jgi:hypothetical protein
MKKIVLKFGLISGLILGVMIAAMVPMCMQGHGEADFRNSEIIGYTTMLAAFLAVFFGIRSYRDNVAGGTITFGKAFQVGILIALVACAFYVITWEITYWGFLPDFADKYAAFSLKKMAAEGASAAQLAEAHTKMEEFKTMYRNPFFNVAVTFVEVFPVGLLVSLISAAILRKKPAPAIA